LAVNRGGFPEVARSVFSIGDFSKITGLTVKTLRFYHEQGLLEPSAVDGQTGYRYYDRSKIETARIITCLRDLDFTLEEIGGILNSAGDDADLRGIMQRQKALLDSRIKRSRAIARSIGKFLAHDEEMRRIMAQASFEIEQKTIEPFRVAGIRTKGRYADCGASFGRIARRVGRYICGKPMLLHYDAEFRENDADFEACIPVRAGASADPISIREIAGGPCVALLHQGPYEELGRSYARILEFIRARRLEVVMPTREIYHKGPGMIFRGNPKNYLTEIQILVAGPADGAAGSTERA
jgi:DNA-binding transcriptional MerR regulator/effector-binding domain-containing protein